MKFPKAIDSAVAETWALTLMRMALGWHLLYLGFWSVTTAGGFSCVGRFRCAHWILADFFHGVAASAAMPVVDGLITAGLLAAGLLLIVGWKTWVASVFGIVYLTVMYVVNPPHFGHTGESHFLFVNRDLIEVVMLALVAARPGVGLVEGLRGWMRGRGVAAPARDAETEKSSAPELDRRQVLAGLSSIPVLAAFGGAAAWTAAKRRDEVIRITGPAVKPFGPEDLAGLGHKIDAYGKIGDVSLSRLVLGGNVIGGWAHGRDMRYYDKMVKAYHTDERVFRTFRMAEACGVNTILTNPALMRVINRYWREDGGKIQFISDCGHAKGVIEGARASVENGASLVYMHGFHADVSAEKGEWKNFRAYLDESRKLGVPVGIGCHRLETVKFCVEHDCLPDFWMKTVHRTDYPTAHIGEKAKKPTSGLGACDNRFVDTDRQTVFDYMKSRPEPWIAFKVLGAGIEHPKDAFPVTFKGGADFICVGMYDYQIVEDVNIANDVFKNGLLERERPWHG